MKPWSVPCCPLYDANKISCIQFYPLQSKLRILVLTLLIFVFQSDLSRPFCDRNRLIEAILICQADQNSRTLWHEKYQILQLQKLY